MDVPNTLGNDNKLSKNLLKIDSSSELRASRMTLVSNRTNLRYAVENKNPQEIDKIIEKRG